MADHTISASFKALTKGPSLVQMIAAALRNVSQAQCADAEERRALEILTALSVIDMHAKAQARPLGLKVGKPIPVEAETIRAELTAAERAEVVGDGVALQTAKHPDAGKTQDEVDQMPDLNPGALETVEIGKDE